MLRFAFAVVAVGLASLAYADDKKDEKKDEKKVAAPTGTWTRSAEGLEVSFAFKKETLTIGVAGGGNGITVKAKYTVEKDGSIKATITDVEEKGDFPNKPAKGLEFTFKFEIDGKKAKLTDFKAEGAEAAKPVVEGDYEAKKD